MWGNVIARSASDEANQSPSFRGDAKHRTRNLEIPGLVLTHHPGMTYFFSRSGRLREKVTHSDYLLALRFAAFLV
jgi:hypothetical protein